MIGRKGSNMFIVILLLLLFMARMIINDFHIMLKSLSLSSQRQGILQSGLKDLVQGPRQGQGLYPKYQGKVKDLTPKD